MKQIVCLAAQPMGDARFPEQGVDRLREVEQLNSDYAAKLLGLPGRNTP